MFEIRIQFIYQAGHVHLRRHTLGMLDSGVAISVPLTQDKVALDWRGVVCTKGVMHHNLHKVQHPTQS